VQVGDWVPAGVDINAPNLARAYDYLLGGGYNFPADRWMAERAAQQRPNLPATVRANRLFLQRAVRHAASAGVRQFLDLGSGMPTAGHVHHVAHEVEPAARVVYVDVDPVAVAHGTAMLASVYAAAMVLADLRDPPAVFAAVPVRDLIDPAEPVAVLMVAVLHLLGGDDPAAVIGGYRDLVRSGSYLILSHPDPHDLPPAANTAGHDAASQRPPGTREEITAWLHGWDLLPPGLTTVGAWHANIPDPTGPDDPAVTDLAGVARKTHPTATATTPNRID